MTQYQAKPVPVQAIRLTDIEITYEKWGGLQKSQKGDWLLSKGGEQYTCESNVFDETYRPLPNSDKGWYYKHAVIDAFPSTQDGSLRTLEGVSEFKKGDYIVTNPGGDRYCIEKAKFEKLYEPIDG